MLQAALDRACPFCGSIRRRGGTLPPDRLAPDSEPVPLIRCAGCGTLESVSGDGPPFEPPTGSYLPHARPGGLKGWLTARSQDRKVSLVLPWVGEGGVVDLGCGAGGFLAAWHRARPGDPAIGLEADPEAAAAARSRGLVIEQIDLSGTLPPAARGRPLYTLWHVIEHLDDPVAVLGTIRDVMAPEGRIVLVVPNAVGLERSLFGARTIAWDPPRHRWHFTPEGLTALVQATGLQVRDRFNLLSDDIYDAVASLQWVLHPRFWVMGRTPRGLFATALALAGGIPAGLVLAALTPWRGRASLGLVLGRD